MRELSATMTRTALSACADLVCKLTTARIGRSSYGRSSWRREFWATFLRATFREENCLEGQKQNPRRSDDSSISVRVYRNAVAGTSLEGWESRVRVAAVCNRVQSVACMKTTLASRTGGRMHTWLGAA